MAILFSGNGTSFARSFVGSGAGTFTVPMTHFSGGTVGFATAQELASLVSSQSDVGACIFQSAIPDDTSLHARYRLCLQSNVLPALEGATNDVQLATAIGNFVMWKIDSRFALGLQLFATFDDVAETASTSMHWCRSFGLDSVANLLDRDTVLRNLCARPVVDSIVIPGDLQIGFPHSLDIQFGLLFTGQAESQGVPFAVALVGDGVDVQNPIGFTDAQGRYTSVITATRDGNVSVTATGCLVGKRDGQRWDDHHHGRSRSPV